MILNWLYFSVTKSYSVSTFTKRQANSPDWPQKIIKDKNFARDGAAAAEGETLTWRCAAELRPWQTVSRG